MMKIAFVVAAATAVVTAAPPATPAKAQELKMAQGVDVQIGRDRYDRYDRDRGRDGAPVGIGPGGLTIGPRQLHRGLFAAEKMLGAPAPLTRHSSVL
jgi:hypothetical protein